MQVGAAPSASLADKTASAVNNSNLFGEKNRCYFVFWAFAYTHFKLARSSAMQTNNKALSNLVSNGATRCNDLRSENVNNRSYAVICHVQRRFAKNVTQNFGHETAQMEAAMSEDWAVVTQNALGTRSQMRGYNGEDCMKVKMNVAQSDIVAKPESSQRVV